MKYGESKTFWKRPTTVTQTMGERAGRIRNVNSLHFQLTEDNKFLTTNYNLKD